MTHMIARLSPLLLLYAANAGRLHLITNKRAGLLDPGTGLLQLDALTLPKTHNKSCACVRSIHSTRTSSLILFDSRA